MKTSFTLLLIIFSMSLLSSQFDMEFQSIIEQYDIDNNIQGITASIHLGENGQWQGSSGFSHGDAPMDTSLLVGVASNTKLFTSAICLKMISHGYFSLDDPLSKWLDPIQFVDASVTVKQLLQHNSGINDFIGNSELFPGQITNNPTKVWTPEETLTYIFEPIAEPGEGIYYSNANYILAAMVLEAATGLKYIDLVRDSIFTPLGLTDIYFEGFEEVVGSMAHPFLFGSDYASIERIALGTTTWSAGSLVSKPRTLSKWYDALFNGQFLSADLMEEMMDFVEWPDDPFDNEMGLGIYRITENDRTYYGHGGRTIGYSSYTLYDVECGHSISVVINEFFSEAYPLAIQLVEKACELVQMPSSTDDLNANFSVFPNPANEYIVVPDGLQFEVFSISGMRIMSKQANSRIDLSQWSNGVYFLKIKSDSADHVVKFVVQH